MATATALLLRQLCTLQRACGRGVMFLLWRSGLCRGDHCQGMRLLGLNPCFRVTRLWEIKHPSSPMQQFTMKYLPIYHDTKKENEPQSCKGWSQFLLYPLQIHSFPKQRKITQLFRSLWQTPIIFTSKYWEQIKIFWRFWNVDSFHVPAIKEIKG